MAFQPAEAPAISGCSLIPPTTLGQKDAPERGAPGAKENGSMTKHVSDTSAARNNSGWLPLSELANRYPGAPGFKVAGN